MSLLPSRTTLHRLLAAVLLTASAIALPGGEAAPAVPGVDLLPEVLKDPELRGTKVVFSVRPPIPGSPHAYETFGYDHKGKVNGRTVGAELRVLDLATMRQEVILADAKGAIRDPAVHYDGRTILFAWRKGTGNHYNLYEIQADGSGIVQVTGGGAFDDFEGCYLPNDEIVFISSRAQRYVPCFVTEVGLVFRTDRSGRNIRRLSAHVDHDMTPWVMHDGTVAFTRWDYIDRDEGGTFSLWSMNPDGSRLGVLKINNYTALGWADVKPVDGTRAVAVQSTKGSTNHKGRAVIIDLTAGPEAMDLRNPKWKDLAKDGEFVGIRPLGTGADRAFNRDPFPLSPLWFLACGDEGLYLVDDRSDRRQLLVPNAQFPPGMMAHEPRLLGPRTREPVIPDLPMPAAPRDPQAAVALTCTLMLQDFYLGRPQSLGGIKRGDVTSLLVLESLPAPVRQTDEPRQFGMGSIWNLKRVIGTVPVEADGSAHFQVPANRSLQVIGLDKDGHSVRRMSSGFTVKPGETMGCIGCHESRNTTAAPGPVPMAMKRPPSIPVREPAVPEIYDYMRHIQPIWDRSCISCHSAEKPAGGLVLTGDRGTTHPLSLAHLVGKRHISVVAARGPYHIPVRDRGANSSPLIPMLAKGHHGVKLTADEHLRLVRWIEVGGQLAGTYAADGTGNATVQIPKDLLANRCYSCHDPKKVTAARPNDTFMNRRDRELISSGFSGRRIHGSYADVFNYNLAKPESSRMLLAPLAGSAGGIAACRTPDGAVAEVFMSRDDPDYQRILAAVRTAAGELNAYELPGFKATPAYFREMKRYGVLPGSFDPATDPWDPLDIDRRYFLNQYTPLFNTPGTP